MPVTVTPIKANKPPTNQQVPWAVSLCLQTRANMSSPASKFVALSLVAYFVSRTVTSVLKLKEMKIGTTETRRSSKMLYYPAMTFCPFRNRNGYLI